VAAAPRLQRFRRDTNKQTNRQTDGHRHRVKTSLLLRWLDKNNFRDSIDDVRRSSSFQITSAFARAFMLLYFIILSVRSLHQFVVFQKKPQAKRTLVINRAVAAV